MGAGKTAVMGEASDALLSRHVNHAAIDLDIVATPLLPEQLSHDVFLKNVASLFDNCRSAGIDRTLVAVVIENTAQLEDLRAASRATEMVVCRLTAAQQTMAARLRTRDPGVRREEFVERSRMLDAILTAAGVEDFSIDNDGRDVTSVATEMLERAGWI